MEKIFNTKLGEVPEHMQPVLVWVPCVRGLRENVLDPEEGSWCAACRIVERDDPAMWWTFNAAHGAGTLEDGEIMFWTNMPAPPEQDGLETSRPHWRLRR